MLWQRTGMYVRLKILTSGYDQTAARLQDLADVQQLENQS